MDFDVIIVGAGSAGATLAARLSENAGRQIALIEAGADFRSAAAPEAMRLPNPARMIFAPELANWRWDELMARRTRAQAPRTFWRGRGVGGSSLINGQIAIRGMAEDFDDWENRGCTGWSFKDVLPGFNRLETDLEFGDQPYHGDDGPIPVYRAPVSKWGAVDHAMAEAALSLGYPWAPDHNAPHALGVSPYAINSRDGKRVTTNDAYVEPARGRNNLSVYGQSRVDRVLWSGTTAIGARHTNCCIRYSSGLEGAGPGDMMAIAMNRLGDSLGVHVKSPDGKPTFGLLAMMLNQCTSRGTVELASRDPSVQPIVEENMLDTASDRVRMRDGIRRLMDIACHSGVSSIGRVRAQGLDLQAKVADADIDVWAMNTAGDGQHATSSCPMGKQGDPITVVDSDCRVLGTQGLRVIDASIMPTVVRANTHLTTVMIAEHMAARMAET